MFLLFFKDVLYRSIIRYHNIAERPTLLLNNRNLQALELETSPQSLSEIIDLADYLTTHNLSFTTGSASSDPNAAYELGKANCVGYAALFTSIARQLMVNAGLENRYEARHLVGKIELLGWDLHQLFDHPFFKDHDFCVVEDLQTGEKIYIDPSVSDYLWIDRVTCKNG